MLNLNPLLSGQAVQVRPVASPDALAREPSAQRPESATPLSPDRFTMGQPWKNKVSVSGGSVSWGVKAYAEQQGKVGEDGQTKQDVFSRAGAGKMGSTGEPLKPEEISQLRELQQVDQKVRAHEQAHMGAAGGLASSGISLSMVKGPDGQNYAVGGEVSIDTSSASTPRETLSKMMKVRAAALAPSDPSAQDRKVAASASVSMGEARAELQLEQVGGSDDAIEDAAERLMAQGSSESEESEDGAPALGGRVGYQQGQYQKAAGDSLGV